MKDKMKPLSLTTKTNNTKLLYITWNPQEDITTFELAQCIPLILMSQYGLINESFIDLKQPYMRNFKID